LTVGSNTYGAWLKARRLAAGLTQEELAHAAIMTRTHIAHIEAGRRFPSEDDARRLDKALNTGDVLTSFRPQHEGTIAEYFEPARLLEQQATMINEFASTYVPGILQTEGYARTIIGATFPPHSAEDRERHVTTRRERTKMLNDTAVPTMWALIDEPVLRRMVGGPKVMAEQIMHIVRLAESERIRVHILPFDMGFHTLMDGMLTLMWFEDQPPAAYSEGLSIGQLHDSPSVVQQLQHRYYLALGESMPTKQSLALMRATAKEYGHYD
jgi:transcriptional regulator with XRE-family HTH domain